MTQNYFDRTEQHAGRGYERHLFMPGRPLQSAEMNEIQRSSMGRLKDIGDALFKDGDVIRDAKVVVNADTGAVQCESGVIYIRGVMRGVSPAQLTVPTIGVVSIGVRLVESVVTALTDPTLRDPAAGTRAYDEEGADRLKIESVWAVGSGELTNYYPIYTVTNGVLDAKEPPPQLDSVTQALAKYDRDSAGGSYVVYGLKLTAMADTATDQVYSLQEGRCRVYGYPFEFTTSRRVTLPITPDLKVILNEPHLSTTAGTQRINFSRKPGGNITQVSITAEKTTTLTHGAFTGVADPIPDTSVLQIIEVKQGNKTYVANTDYKLTDGNVDWSPSGAEPSTGSTYTVKYQFISVVTPTAVDDTGFSVTGAVSGTLVLVSYSQKLPRIDRLCVNSSGQLVWIEGVAADFNPQYPAVPDDLLAIASVFQTWTSSRRVVNDGVRVVPMPSLSSVESKLDRMMGLIAQTRLESSIHTREGGTKKGLFTDPFIDDSQRDQGTPQTAAVYSGILTLAIDAGVSSMNSDITVRTALPHADVESVSQTLRTGSMKINPYMAFDTLPAQVSLTPSVDRWTDVQSSWTSPLTLRFSQGSGENSSFDVSTRDVLVIVTTSVAETLRSIPVAYSVAGFGPGEILDVIKFDGVSLSVPNGQQANAQGVVSGTFQVPTGVPTGTKLVEFVGRGGSRGSATYTGQGTVERQVFQQRTTITETRWQSPPPPAPVVRNSDPLAQTFTLPVSQQISGVELWFAAVPTSATSVQIRDTIAGVPGQTVIASAVRNPSQISGSGTPTTFTFESPVSLLAGTEYAIVVLCNDATGALAVAELGKFDANAQKWITSQPYTVGVLLSSSNASTWTPHQDRDLTFRLLRASYSATTSTLALGTVAVSGVTDLMVMAYADRPRSETNVKYLLSLPSGTQITVDDGQAVELAEAVSGNISVSALLTGTESASPILYPGTQLVHGVVHTSDTYVTRAVPAGQNSRIKVIYEARVPSGSSLELKYKGIDAGDAWVTVPQIASTSVDSGFVEFVHEISSVNESAVQVQITLSGNTAARPVVRDLRVMVL